jgi:predicted metal-dependent HD superfamily phosphohydrolase
VGVAGLQAYESRAYHSLNHQQEMLRHLPGLSTFAAPATEPIFSEALIHQNEVYRAGQKSNGARSADQIVASGQD